MRTVGRPLDPCSDAPERMQVRYAGPRTAYQQLMNNGTSAARMDSMRLAEHSPPTLDRFQRIQANCRAGVTLRNQDIE
jgi:hypothetical protein